jgi:hypothetical protein
MWSPDMLIGMACTLTGIATARAKIRARSARARESAMTGKVTLAHGQFKQRPFAAEAVMCAMPFLRGSSERPLPFSAMGRLCRGQVESDQSIALSSLARLKIDA